MTPEIKLWVSVITQAITDLTLPAETMQKATDKDAAYKWFNEARRDFKTVCYYAELDPSYVLDKIKHLLEKYNVENN